MQQLGAVRIKPSSQHARPACRAAAVSLCTLPGPVRPQTWLSLKLLAIPIRMILFLCSFDFSSRVFFAWQVRVHVLVGCVARRSTHLVLSSAAVYDPGTALLLYRGQ